VTIIVTGSSDDIIFSSSHLHYDSSVLNVSAYETVGTNFTINVGHKTGRKNITGTTLKNPTPNRSKNLFYLKNI
jgi:hypothetical protein